jgi:hypothetical protein
VDFYLGTDRLNWLSQINHPLMVSHRVLRNRKKMPRAIGSWVLDSGAFSEISQYGEWTVPVIDYIKAVIRYRDEIGNMVWAAPMDWMCEPWIIEKTGLTVKEHQQRTTKNYLDLVCRAPDLPWIPILQGWTLDDYHRHVEGYLNAGISLQDHPVVGIGSVCRRQATAEAAGIIRSLWAQGIKNLHGFGFKVQGLREVGALMASADSMAWSYNARRSKPLPSCTHKKCNHCQKFALQWREKVVAGIPNDFQAPLM